MERVHELQRLIHSARTEFERACDEGRPFHDKNEIQQRLKQYVHELNQLIAVDSDNNDAEAVK